MSMEATRAKGHTAKGDTAQSGKTTLSVPRPNRQEHWTGRSQKSHETTKTTDPRTGWERTPRTAIPTGIPDTFEAGLRRGRGEIVASSSWLQGGIHSRDETSESCRNLPHYLIFS